MEREGRVDPLVGSLTRTRRCTMRREKPETVCLFQFPKRPIGPFCIKVELYLRWANIPYENVATCDIGAAPYGKLPYIRHRGTQIGDSYQIINYLNRTFGCDFDQHLTPEQRAVALALDRTLTQTTYYVMLYSRWSRVVPGNRDVIHRYAIKGGPFYEAFNILPALFRPLLVRLIAREFNSQVYYHGIGRLPTDRMWEVAAEEIAALSAYLGDKPFFLGEQPATVDAAMFGGLVSIVEADWNSPLKGQIQQTDTLMGFIERIKQRFWQDWQHDVPAHPDYIPRPRWSFNLLRGRTART